MNSAFQVWGIVDDILSIQKCSVDTVKSNAVINAFINSKKITLSHKKCNINHISRKTKRTKDCPAVKVHGSVMTDSEKEK